MSREMIGTLANTKVSEKSIRHSINDSNGFSDVPEYTLRSQHCNSTKITAVVECKWSEICCTTINDSTPYQYLMLEI